MWMHDGIVLEAIICLESDMTVRVHAPPNLVIVQPMMQLGLFAR